MTDHNREDREALIEKAAAAILNEMGGIVPDELEQMHEDAARAALTVFEHAPTVQGTEEPEWEYGVMAPSGRMVNNGAYRVQQTHRRRKAGPWEPVPITEEES